MGSLLPNNIAQVESWGCAFLGVRLPDGISFHIQLSCRTFQIAPRSAPEAEIMPASDMERWGTAITDGLSCSPGNGNIQFESISPL